MGMIQSTGKFQSDNVGAGTVTFNFPGNITAGNTVIVTLAVYNDQTFRISALTASGTSGTRDVDKASADNANHAEIWRVTSAAGGSTAVAITLPSGVNYLSGCAEEWDNISTSSPLDQSGTGGPTAGSSAPSATAAGSTSQADTVSYAVFCDYAGTNWTSSTPPSGYTENFEEHDGTAHEAGAGAYKVLSATGTETATFTTGASMSWICSLAVYKLTGVGSATREQEGARFRNDDGSETTATWAASQDSNHTAALSTNLRLRALVNATGDPATGAYTLRYQKNGSGGYVAVPVGATVPEAYGTVTFQSIGTGANGSTTVAPTYPASIASGDYLVCVVTSGATNSETPTTPSGWTLLATGASTDGTYGIDTGPRRVTAFGKIADGTESGTLTVSITNGGTCRGTISRFTKAGSGSWNVEAQGGNDSTSGTGVSIAFASMNWNTGDAVLVATGQRVDSATQSAQSLTATGVTFGTRTNRAATAVTTGNDHRHTVDTFAAISSTSDVDAAPTWAYTASAAASAGGVIVRLREYTAPVTNEVYVATSANITAGGEATTAQLTAPSGKSTSDFVTGRMWDDENGTDSIDITTDDYTELEWCLQAQSPATNGDYFDFRVYAGAAALDTYTVTPRWTLGSGSTPSSTGPMIQTQARRYAPLQFF